MTLSRNLWEHLEDPTESPSQKERNHVEQPARTAVRHLRTADLGLVTSVYLDCEHVAFCRTKIDRNLATVKHQTALTAAPLMNARMSALITSAFVVIIPCEKPGKS